jgi:hypothetical protein
VYVATSHAKYVCSKTNCSIHFIASDTLLHRPAGPPYARPSKQLPSSSIPSARSIMSISQSLSTSHFSRPSGQRMSPITPCAAPAQPIPHSILPPVSTFLPDPSLPHFPRTQLCLLSSHSYHATASRGLHFPRRVQSKVGRGQRRERILLEQLIR